MSFGRAARWLRTRRAGLRWRFEMLRNRLFDMRYGVETQLAAGLAEQGVSAAQAAEGNNIYRPVWISEFRRFMRALGVAPCGFTFVDFGSGKGKMLMLAAEYGFRKVIGVEYASGLHAVALENIRKFTKRSKPGADISAIHADARAFELPPGPLVMIMFNPFDAEVSRVVAAQIEAEYRRNPRDMYLLYANRRDVAEIGDALTGLKVFRCLKATRHVVLFHASGSGEGDPKRV